VKAAVDEVEIALADKAGQKESLSQTYLLHLPGNFAIIRALEPDWV